MYIHGYMDVPPNVLHMSINERPRRRYNNTSVYYLGEKKKPKSCEQPVAYYGLLWLITILPVFGTRKDYIRMPIRNPRGLDFPIVCLVNVRSQLDIDILLDMLEEEKKAENYKGRTKRTCVQHAFCILHREHLNK